MDPRVKATETDLQALFALESKLSGMVTGSSTAALEAHSAREQLTDLLKTAPYAQKASIESLDKQLEALLDGTEHAASQGSEKQTKQPEHPKDTKAPAHTPQPEAADTIPGLDDVSAEAAALYATVGLADAAPTSAQVQAADHSSHELNEVLEHWEHLEHASIPELNRSLHAAHLPEIDLKRKPLFMPEGGDEE
jgi:hypothetical protein